MRDSWEVKNISELCDVKGGKRLPAGEEFDIGKTPFPYLRVTNMVNGSIDDSDLKYVKIEIEPLIRNYKISKDDLYVTIAGTLGKFGSIPDHLDNAQLTENAAKLSDINLNIVSKKYLKYYLNSQLIRNQIFREIGVGGGVPKLAIHRIESLKVNFPKKVKEQKKIAQILSTCDKVLEKTEAAISKYQALKQGMLHDLFTRGIDIQTGQLRPSYEDAPGLYKETELGFVPLEWEVEQLGEVSDKIGDGIHSTPSYISNSKYYFINGNNLKNGNIVIKKNTNCVSKKEYLKHYKNLSPNTILYSINGTIGNIAYYQNEQIVLGKSAAYISFSDVTLMEYVYNFLQTETIKIFFEIQLTGSTIKNLSLAAIRMMPTKMPIKDETLLINKRLKSIDQKIHIERQTLAKYEQLKAGLMQDLLTGKVEVGVDKEQV